MVAGTPDQFGMEGPCKPRHEVLKDLGDCHAALGECSKAREYYRQACDAAPEQPGGYVGLGLVALQSARLGEARGFFEIAKAIRPDCAQAYGGLAMVYQQQRDYPSAFEMYLRFLQYDPDNLVALLGLFQTSVRMGTFRRIIEYLEVYLDRHPGDTSVLFCLASLYVREGRLDQARRALHEVCRLEPGKEEAEALLAEVEERLAQV